MVGRTKRDYKTSIAYLKRANLCHDPFKASTYQVSTTSGKMPGKREVSVACTQLSCTWDKEGNLVSI